MKKCIVLWLTLCLLLGGCSLPLPTQQSSQAAKAPAPEPPPEYYTTYYADPSLRSLQADVTYRSDAYTTLGRLNNLYGGWAQGLYELLTAQPLPLSKLSAPNLGWIRMAFSTGEGEQTEVFTLYENNLLVTEHPKAGKRSCTVSAGTYATVLAYLDGVRQEQRRYFSLSPQHNNDEGYHEASYTLYNAKGKAVVNKKTAAVTPTVEMVGEGLVRVTDSDGTRLYEPYTGRKSVVSQGPTDLFGDRLAVTDGHGAAIYALFGTKPSYRLYTADAVESLRFSADGESLHIRVRNAVGTRYDRTVSVQEEIDSGVVRLLGEWREMLTPATEKEEQTDAYNILKKLRHKEAEFGFYLSGTLVGRLQIEDTDYFLCELGHWATDESGAVSHYEVVTYLMVPTDLRVGYVATSEDNELSWDTQNDWFRK